MNKFDIFVNDRLLAVFKQRHGVYLVLQGAHEVGTVYAHAGIKKNTNWEPFIEANLHIKILEQINNYERFSSAIEKIGASLDAKEAIITNDNTSFN